jgi:hypothetical protein
LKALAHAATTLALAEEIYSRDAEHLLSRVKVIGVRKCAMLAGIDAGHLTRLVGGKRRVTGSVLERLKRALASLE